MQDQPFVRFTPRKIVGALFIILPTIAVVSIVVAILPKENVPSIVKLADGSTAYQFTSLRELIIPPVAIVCLILFSVIAGRVLSTRYYVRENIAWSETGPISRGIACVVVAGLIGMAALLCVSSVISLFREIRTITVHPDTVVVESLLQSWRVPRRDIMRVELCRENAMQKGQPKVFLRLEIDQRGGVRYSTKQWNLNNADPALPRYLKCVAELENQLKQQRK